MPLVDFLQKIELKITPLICYQICIWGFCFVCCYRPDTDQWFCDKQIVILS